MAAHPGQSLHRPNGPFNQRQAAKAYYASRGLVSAAGTAAAGTINLVSRDNGIGLTTDMRLLEQLLGGAGYDVLRVDWTRRQMRPCQVAIFLELWNPILANFAKTTVGVFNLEWLRHDWQAELPKLTQLWAKSVEAQQVYQRLGLRSHYTGFLARDIHDPNVKRELTCMHLRGHSAMKGTETVLETWRRYRDLPPLTVISAVPLNAPPGVTVLPRLADQELVTRLNAAQIHVCPSRSEGWGHYIAEALSVGAIVVTTNGSPMNEHVRPEWGIVVEPAARTARGLVEEHHIDPEALAAAVRQAATLSDVDRRVMGARARAHLAAGNASFTTSAATLLKGLGL